jgi:hypothetical protein
MWCFYKKTDVIKKKTLILETNILLSPFFVYLLNKESRDIEKSL